MSLEPTFLTLRARDVKPYHYGIWCNTGGEPFANCICAVKWSADGTHLLWFLETHHSTKVEPDKEVEVVDLRGNPVWEHTRERYTDWELSPPPVSRYDHAYRWSPDGPECDLCGSVHQPNLEPVEGP